jgi:hypothetical protein
MRRSCNLKAPYETVPDDGTCGDNVTGRESLIIVHCAAVLACTSHGQIDAL